MSKPLSTVAKTALVLLWLVFLAFIGALGLLIAHFMGIYFLPLAGSTLVVLLALLCLLFWMLRRERPSSKHFLRAAGALLALALLIPFGYDRFVVNRYEAVRDRHFRWHEVQPFSPLNTLPKAAPDAACRFAGEPPHMSGRYMLYPVYAAAFQALAAAPPDNLGTYMTYGSNPDSAFQTLSAGEVDLIFDQRPGPEQLAAMRDAKLRYTLTPLLHEALVFFVHKDNPATGLTQEQLRAIYSGRVTSWQELGVPLDAPLRPYQRRSSSQTAFERFMGDTPIMKPEMEDTSGDMGGTYKTVADYRNHVGAIGFSLRYYTTKLGSNPNIKFLTIDGVAPTEENIQGGSYPLATEFYAITARPREGNVARMIDFLRSPEGQRLIDASGYVPAPPGAEDVVLE